MEFFWTTYISYICIASRCFRVFQNWKFMFAVADLGIREPPFVGRNSFSRSCRRNELRKILSRWWSMVTLLHGLEELQLRKVWRENLCQNSSSFREAKGLPIQWPRFLQTCLFLVFSWAHWPFSPLHSRVACRPRCQKMERIAATRWSKPNNHLAVARHEIVPGAQLGCGRLQPTCSVWCWEPEWKVLGDIWMYG